MAAQPHIQSGPEELPLELLHGELVCSDVLLTKDQDVVS